MSITTELLDRWKAAKNIESDNQAAIKLGLGRATVSRWRHDEQTEASAETVKRMAEELQEDPTAYVLMAEAKKQKYADSRKALEALAKKFFPFAATLLLAAFAREGNCKQLQSYTNIFLHNTSIVSKGTVIGWARKLLTQISQRLTGKLSWSFHLAASPLAA